MDGRRVTIGELKKGLDAAIKDGVSEGAVILWTEATWEGDEYCSRYHIVPGTVLFGLEYFEDGQVERGTLEIQPSKLSEKLN